MLMLSDQSVPNPWHVIPKLIGLTRVKLALTRSFGCMYLWATTLAFFFFFSPKNPSLISSHLIHSQLQPFSSFGNQSLPSSSSSLFLSFFLSAITSLSCFYQFHIQFLLFRYIMFSIFLCSAFPPFPPFTSFFHAFFSEIFSIFIIAVIVCLQITTPS